MLSNMPLVSETLSSLYFQRLLDIHDNSSGKYYEASVKLRYLLDEIFNELTKEDKQVFENLFARMIFCERTHGFSPELSNAMHIARKRLNKIIFRTKEETTKRDYTVAISALAYIIQFLGNVQDVPETIVLLQHEAQVKNINWHEAFNTELYQALRVTFIKAMPLPEGCNPDEEYHIELSHEKLGAIIFIARNHKETDTNGYPNNMILECKKAWPLACLHFHDITTLEVAGYKVPVYTSNIKTTLVIEPDFLIEASQLADGLLDLRNMPKGEKPLQYFARKLVSGSISSALVIGNLVNYALDAMMAGTDRADLQFEEFAKNEQLLYYVILGEEEIKQLIFEVKEHHLDALEDFVAYVKNAGLQAYSEVSYMSNRYGIQGRLDVQLVNKSDDDEQAELDIIELKAGKFPQVIPNVSNDVLTKSLPIVYPNHESQVNAYELLINSCYENAGKQRKGTNAVLYSKAGKGVSLRNVNRISHTTQRLMQLRNSVIAALYYLAEGSKTALAFKRLLDDTGLLASYLQKSGLLLTNLVLNDLHISSSYYIEFLAFQLRELWASKTGAFRNTNREDGGFSDLWLKATALKVDSCSVITTMKLESMQADQSLLEFTYPQEIHHSFREGDFCIIYQYQEGEAEVGAVMKQQTLKGIIRHLSKGKLTFYLKNKQADFESLLAFEGFYQLEADNMDTSHWNNVQGVLRLCTLPYSQRDKILGVLPSETLPITTDIPYEILAPLTPVRQSILKDILSAKEYYLLQGPPGTGKTSQMLISIVKATLQMKINKHITILAYTNKAIEEITHKLNLHGLEYISLGGQDADDVHRISVMAKSMPVDAIKSQLQDCEIIVSTVHTYQSRLVFIDNIVPHDLLIIDEASQIPDHQTAAVMSLFQKSVLIGDQNQLAAVVVQAQQYTEVRSPRLREIGITNLKQSLFERLFNQCKAKNWAHSIATLPEHYRMHEDIARLITHYYDNQLLAVTDRQKAAWHFAPVDGYERESQILGRSRTLFIDTPVELVPKLNKGEAQLAITLASAMLANNSCNTVGIVCPWRAQVAAVRQLAEEHGLPMNRIIIETVEKFQGMECDFIIASTAVDSFNRLQAMQSLSADGQIDKKLNVAISRAKEQFVLLGNFEVLVQSPHYAELIQKMDASGGRVGFEEVEIK